MLSVLLIILMKILGEILNKIRKKGIALAIDDFGTGYSSMSYLKKLPINRLKIDKSFVDDLPNSIESVAIVKAIISLAKTFGLSITAEGVENKEQLDFLINENCDEIQGYYFSKPITFEELKVYIPYEVVKQLLHLTYIKVAVYSRLLVQYVGLNQEDIILLADSSLMYNLMYQGVIEFIKKLG